MVYFSHVKNRKRNWYVYRKYSLESSGAPDQRQCDLDSDGLSPYESGYVNGYNDALVNLLNALNIEHDFHHFD